MRQVFLVGLSLKEQLWITVGPLCQKAFEKAKSSYLGFPISISSFTGKLIKTETC